MDKAAREQTILKHLRFAHCSGFESMPGAMRHLHGDDAQQEAAIGLIQAVDRYDPARNDSLRNFARPRVRGAVKDYVRCATLVGRWRQDSPNSHCQVASLADVDDFPAADPGHPSPERLAIARSLFSLVDRHCKPRTAAMIRLWTEGLTYKEIGARWGVGEPRAFQIVTGGIAKIQSLL